MRITIDTDDKGNVKLGSFDGAADIPVIDAGPAPVEHIQRMSSVFAAADGGGMSLPISLPSAPDPHAKTPLNPLRAGSAAARREVPATETQAAMPTTDGGRAAHVGAGAAVPAGAATEKPDEPGKPDKPPPKRAKARSKR